MKVEMFILRLEAAHSLSDIPPILYITFKPQNEAWWSRYRNEEFFFYTGVSGITIEIQRPNDTSKKPTIT